MRRRLGVPALVAAACFHAGAVLAADPLLVNGAGTPLAWTVNSVPFNPDQGPLGILTNASAVNHVATNFDVWASVSTTSIAFSDVGTLPADVTASNFMAYIGNCSDGLSPIIFDTDGSVTDALLGAGANNVVLGFAGPDCVTMVPPGITEGVAVLNGKFINGIDTSSDSEMSVADFDAVFIHEFGHYIGLAHSQIGHQEAEDGDASNDNAIATMYPIAKNGAEQAILNLDDQVSVSALYPAPSFFSAFGSVTGSVLLPNGTSPVQGAYVVARKLGDARASAVGAASGARFFPFNEGLPPPGTLEGVYEIPGLPAGDYTIEVEPIDTDFRGASGVGPLDPPQALPGPPEFWNGANESYADPPDDPAESVPINMTAGITQAGINIILEGMPVPVPNDNFSSAEDIFEDAGATSGTNVGATREVGEPLFPFYGGYFSTRTVWYRWIAPRSFNVTFTTDGSTFDTLLWVFQGDSVGELSEVVGNDDNPGFEGGAGTDSFVRFDAVEGEEYRIVVGGFLLTGEYGVLEVDQARLGPLRASCRASSSRSESSVARLIQRSTRILRRA